MISWVLKIDLLHFLFPSLDDSLCSCVCFHFASYTSRIFYSKKWELLLFFPYVNPLLDFSTSFTLTLKFIKLLFKDLKNFKNWDIIDILYCLSLRYTACWFDTCIYYNMNTSIALAKISITSHNYHFLSVVRTCKI